MKVLAKIYASKYPIWAFQLTMLSVLTWLFYPALQQLSWNLDPTMGFIDPTIWILIALSFGCFLLMSSLSAWLINAFWHLIDLPRPSLIISQFNSLTSCQKLQFLFGAYALLLLSGVGCLVAIC